MCGVFGWATPRPFDDRGWLKRTAAALSHRGPDGTGCWRAVTKTGSEIALGHTRLSIIDIDGGAQPLWSHDRRFVISFNGEIYNYLELRETLQARGCRFVTRSDTEVLMEAYRVWGEGCLERLNGMFAFALYDTHANRLLMARDPFGKKPLFLATLAGGVAFASEIPPLLDLPGIDRGLNHGVIGDYLLRRYAPGPATFFQGVRKLPPGHLAIYEGGRVTERRYFTPPLAQIETMNVSPDYAATAFRTGLHKAVKLRLRSDAAYGVYLSGGLDSSAIAAVMAQNAGTVKSFAVGFEDAAYCELHHAARVADRIGARHQALTVTAADFARHWPDAVRHRGAPVSEASDIPILMLSRAAKDSVKMVLTGEGADELLAGYPKHRAERWIGGYQALVPVAWHRRLVEPLVDRAPYGARRLKILSRALGAATPQVRAQLWFASMDPKVAARLYARAPANERSVTAASSTALRHLMLTDQTGWLPDNLLERGDRMMMAAGVEGRMPFMDADLAALVASFPDALLFDRRGGKAILRAAAADLLDAKTLHRRKAGFRAPVGDWFRGSMRPMLQDLLCGEGSAVRRLLHGAVIDRLLAEHLGRRADHTDALWTVANLELFLREFGLNAR